MYHVWHAAALPLSDQWHQLGAAVTDSEQAVRFVLHVCGYCQLDMHGLLCQLTIMIRLQAAPDHVHVCVTSLVHRRLTRRLVKTDFSETLIMTHIWVLSGTLSPERSHTLLPARELRHLTSQQSLSSSSSKLHCHAAVSVSAQQNGSLLSVTSAAAVH